MTEQTPSITELLKALGDAPEGQADAQVSQRCRVMAEEGFTAADIKDLLDDIAYYALASELVILALDCAWKQTLALEQGKK